MHVLGECACVCVLPADQVMIVEIVVSVPEQQ